MFTIKGVFQFLFFCFCVWFCWLIHSPIFFQTMISITDYVVWGKTDGWGIICFFVIYGIFLFWLQGK